MKHLKAWVVFSVASVVGALTPLTGFVSADDTGPKDEEASLEFLSLNHSPEDVGFGDEMTVTAQVRNQGPLLALIEFRLQLPEELEVVAPDIAQIVFIEPNTTREIKWKTKVVGEGEWSYNASFGVISNGRPVSGSAPEIPALIETALTKVWTGTWKSPSGFVFNADMHLQFNATGSVEGRFNWTLKEAPEDSDNYAGKIDQTGVEYIWGEFDPETRQLKLDGYRRDDPQNILGLDRYRLTLSPFGDRLEGITWNHGTWKGEFRLVPKEDR